MKQNSWILGFLLLVNVSCTMMKKLSYNRMLTRSEVLIQKDTVFTYQSLNNKISVPVAVNDGPPVEFFIDSGAPTYIDSDFTRRSNFLISPVRSHRNRSNVNVSPRRFTADNLTYAIMGSTFTKRKTGQVKLGENLKMCHKAFGIIGSDILSSAVLYLYPRQRKIGFLYNCSDSLRSTLPEFKRVKVILNPLQRNPLVAMSLGSLERMALLDLGSNMDLLILYNPKRHQKEMDKLLHSFAPERIRKVNRIMQTIHNMEGSGLSNMDTNSIYYVTFDSIALGGAFVQGPFELQISAYDGNSLHCNIGMAFMNRFESFLDYPGKTLYLRRDTNLKIDSRALSPRIIFSKRHGNILGLEDCAPWKQHTVQFGDTVTAVNGISLSRLMEETEPCRQDERLQSELRQLRSIVIRQRNGKEVSILLPYSLPPKQ